MPIAAEARTLALQKKELATAAFEAASKAWAEANVEAGRLRDLLKKADDLLAQARAAVILAMDVRDQANEEAKQATAADGPGRAN